MSRTVIVGNGIAGMSAAESLRVQGYSGSITVLGDEPGRPYRRTAVSKDIARTAVTPESFDLRGDDHWTERGIEVRTGTRVRHADTACRTVTCDDGSILDHDVLILATGGRARTVDAVDVGVPTLRTREDAARIHRLLQRGDALTVVGGGLIGLELAASAAGAGHEVWVVEAADRLMGRVVPPEISAFLATLHARHGVSVRTGSSIAAASPERVLFADGTARRAPVIAAIGMAPDLDLARQLDVDTSDRGIIVDAHLRTSAEGVYAAGDVAAVPHALTGEPTPTDHWLAATDQGRAVAGTVMADLAGDVAEQHVAIPLAWTVQYGVNIQIAGWPAAGEQVEIDGDLEAGDATVRVLGPAGMVGAVAVGRPAQGRRCRDEIRDLVMSTDRPRSAV